MNIVKLAVISGNRIVKQVGDPTDGLPFSIFVEYAGTEPVQFVWYRNNLQILNSDNDTITFPTLNSTDNGTYICIVKNQYGSDTSLNYTILHGQNGAPVFQNSKTIQSYGTIKKDSSLLLYVGATGSPAPAFSWYRNSVIITGKTEDTLSFARLSINDTGTYRCIAENVNGKDTTVAFTISLDHVTNTAPEIFNNGQIGVSGKDSMNSTLIIFISVQRGGELTYLWYKNGKEITAAINDSLVFTKLSFSDSGSYFCVVKNVYGADTSSAYTIQIGGASKPLIQNSKQIQITGKPYKESSVSLSITATGTAPLLFSWFKGVSVSVLSTTNTLTFSKFTAADAGSYYCIVTNGTGSDTSVHFPLTMLNRRPITIKSDTLKIVEDDTIKNGINISGNDPDGDSLSWQIVSGPFKGSIGNAKQGHIVAENELSYLLSPDSNGIDSIKYFLSDGNVNSDTAFIYISIISAKDSVVIVKQPEDQRRKAGQSSQFSITAAGVNLRYQWQLNSISITGATEKMYTIPTISEINNGASIRCMVYNTEDTVYTKIVTITVLHTIAFNSNNALTGDVPVDTFGYASGAPATIPGNTGSLIKTGQMFKGWNRQADGSGLKTYIINDTLIMPSSNVVLYVKWVIDTLTVNFISNGGDSVPSQKVIYNQQATEPSVKPTKNGYVFNGWYMSSSGTGTEFDFATLISSSRTLYAGWTPVYRVIYHANGGTGSVPIDNNQYKSGDIVSVLGNTGSSLKGFSFSEWSTTKSGAGTSRTPLLTYQKGPGNDTLFARWNIIQYNIHYVLNGGIDNPANTKTYNVQSPAITLQNLSSKTDSTFDGWYANAAFSTKVTSIPTNSIGDDTLYAKWTWANTITDIDNNVYPTVKIGNQIWTSVNLRVTRFNDETAIKHVPDSVEWSSSGVGAAYCFYANTTVLAEQRKNGALYNREAVNIGELAPKGWHVPTAEDWLILREFLCKDTTQEYNTAKAIASKTDWNYSDSIGAPGRISGNNDKTGFNALPVGMRWSDGEFGSMGDGSSWWIPSLGDSDWRYLFSISNYSKYLNDAKSFRIYESRGCSVRLIKD